MNLAAVLTGLENMPISAAMRGDSGWPWLFPTVETLHVMSLAMVFGSIIMVDLRLLGVAARDNAVSKLSQEVLPFTWTAFICAAITGTLMFISKAHVYFHNPQFQFKFLCIFLAGANMLVFHFGTYRHVLEWEYQRPPPAGARVAGATSIMLWIGVIFFGRWVGFTT